MAFEASWEGPIEGYVKNYLAEHHWKIARTCQRDDALQEAYCVFLRVRRKYAGQIEEPKHFMALFKTAWYHEFTDLANADTKHRVECQMPINEEGEPLELIGELDNDGVLAVMIKEAPRDVALVLALLLSAPQEILDLALGSLRRDGRSHHGGSTRLNRLLGLPVEQDTIGSVIEYFR